MEFDKLHVLSIKSYYLVKHILKIKWKKMGNVQNMTKGKKWTEISSPLYENYFTQNIYIYDEYCKSMAVISRVTEIAILRLLKFSATHILKTTLGGHASPYSIIKIFIRHNHPTKSLKLLVIMITTALIASEKFAMQH